MRPPAPLPDWLEDAHRRTLELVGDLDGERLLGPRLAIVNPPLWEVGHVGWFTERWVLRDAAGGAPLRAEGDALYDSSTVPHRVRWDLPLPSWGETLDYLGEVTACAVEALAGELGRSDLGRQRALLSVFHEDMHGEAFTYTRHTLGYAPPPARGGEDGASAVPAGPLPGDAAVPGGTLALGSSRDEPFVFDNEKWAHPVELRPFSIARAPVTQAEFAAFVDAGGYGREELWSAAGWRWRAGAGAEHPVYWRRCGGGWLRREFDREVELEPHRPVIQVCWWEAEAYCAWARRRLPTEAEWEAAAACEPGAGGKLGPRKRPYPWGDEPPGPSRARLDAAAIGCADVAAFPEGDSAFGCRQMLGNVWEWTASDFLAYPGFSPDAYRDYSLPWFGTHKVLRGGCWATRSRLVHCAYRNFFTPDRRDVLAGFRTCAR